MAANMVPKVAEPLLVAGNSIFLPIRMVLYGFWTVLMDVFVEPSYNSLFSPKSSRLSSSICGLNCWDRRAGYVAPS